jgi:hypothetical protein
LGSEAFVEKAGVLVGRDLQKKKPGRKGSERGDISMVSPD